MPRTKEAGHISTGWPENDHLKTLDFSFLLKTSPVLERFVVDLHCIVLAPVYGRSPNNA